MNKALLSSENMDWRSREAKQSAAGRKKMRAVLKYPGSKWSIADWIISYFPEHHSYLEPFFGSGAVLFCKPRSNIETVNDLDGNVVNLFEWIKKDPERLAHEIYFTPYARQVYEDAFAAVPADSFGRAVNFYTRLNRGQGQHIRWMLCIPCRASNPRPCKLEPIYPHAKGSSPHLAQGYEYKSRAAAGYRR